MPTAYLEIQDEVNVRFLGVPRNLITVAQKEVTHYVPGFMHMPAHKFGPWDGTIKLLSPTGKTFLNLVDKISPTFERAGYDFEITDNRIDCSAISDALEYVTKDSYAEYSINDKPIILRDYQIEAINTALQEGGGLLEMATGSGKTITTGAIADIYSKHGKVVVIVPTIDLALQTQATFQKMGIDAGIWYGAMKEQKQVTISTWQSLDNYPELFMGVISVIVDEAHQATAKVLVEILSGPACNVPFRYGCTGTVPTDGLSQDQIRGVIGDIIFSLNAWELQERGVLAQANVVQIELQDTHNPKWISAVAFEEWSEELDWMFGDPARIEYVCNLFRDIAETEGNLLILVPYRKHGKILSDNLEGSISLDGKDKAEYRRDVYEKFNNGDNQILICTFGIASTGIDIPRIMAMGFFEPGKKFQKVIQSVGRGLRKADDKDSVLIVDVVGNIGFSKRHAATRRTLYKEARLPTEVIKVDYVNLG